MASGFVDFQQIEKEAYERDLSKMLPMCYALSKQLEALGVLLEEIRRLPPPEREVPAGRAMRELRGTVQGVETVRQGIAYMAGIR